MLRFRNLVVLLPTTFTCDTIKSTVQDLQCAALSEPLNVTSYFVDHNYLRNLLTIFCLSFSTKQLQHSSEQDHAS